MPSSPTTLLSTIVAALLLPIVKGQKELAEWREDRYINCIFCMDFDNRASLSVFSCSLPTPPTCRGNLCYMAQYKSYHYYLYTSGCLNLTQGEYSTIAQRLSTTKPERGARGGETQLCEVIATKNACLCENKNFCNNISSGDPFVEYTTNFLDGIHFNELAHFRYFAPNDAILAEFQDDPRHFSSDTSTKSLTFTLIFIIMLKLFLQNP